MVRQDDAVTSRVGGGGAGPTTSSTPFGCSAVSNERAAATLAGTPWRATLDSSTMLPETMAPELAALAGSARRLTKFEDKGRRREKRRRPEPNVV